MELERLGVFIDGASFFHMQKFTMRWWIDPVKFLKYLDFDFPTTNVRECPENYPQVRVAIAHYYMFNDEGGGIETERFSRALSYGGYGVVKRYFDFESAGQNRFDPIIRTPMLLCDMIADIFSLSGLYDRAIIVGTDNNIFRTLASLQRMNRPYTVFGAMRSVGTDLWPLLGPNFVDFDTIRDKIEKSEVSETDGSPLEAPRLMARPFAESLHG